MHLSETDAQRKAQPLGDGFSSRTVVRLKRGDSAFLPDESEAIEGPVTAVYVFNPAGTHVELFDPWPLPLWALRAVKRLRWLARR